MPCLGGRNMRKRFVAVAVWLSVAAIVVADSPTLVSAEETSLEGVAATHSGPVTAALAAELGVEFVKGSTSSLVLERGGKKYVINALSRTITQADSASPSPASQNLT